MEWCKNHYLPLVTGKPRVRRKKLLNKETAIPRCELEQGIWHARTGTGEVLGFTSTQQRRVWMRRNPGSTVTGYQRKPVKHIKVFIQRKEMTKRELIEEFNKMKKELDQLRKGK